MYSRAFFFYNRYLRNRRKAKIPCVMPIILYRVLIEKKLQLKIFVYTKSSKALEKHRTKFEHNLSILYSIAKKIVLEIFDCNYL